MFPRIPSLADVEQIASIHVRCWRETYVGLLPNEEIAKRDMTYRQTLWSKMIEADMSHISMIDGIGFAQVGLQRDHTLAAQFPRELFALYVLQEAHGTGAAQSLLHHALSQGNGAFSTLVLKGNARATAFYRKSGGVFLKEVTDTIGYIDLAFGWSVPIQLHR